MQSPNRGTALMIDHRNADLILEVLEGAVDHGPAGPRTGPRNIQMIAARLRWIISALTHPRAEARILAHEPASRGSRVVPLIHPRSTRQIAHCADLMRTAQASN